MVFRSTPQLPADAVSVANPDITRSPICLERLSQREDGEIQYQLKRPFSNGTTHVLFSPLDFISRLTTLILKPRRHLVRDLGAFARGCHQPNAKTR